MWLLDRPQLIGTDGVHPTDAGHAYLSALIEPVVARRWWASRSPDRLIGTGMSRNA